MPRREFDWLGPEGEANRSWPVLPWLFGTTLLGTVGLVASLLTPCAAGLASVCLLPFAIPQNMPPFNAMTIALLLVSWGCGILWCILFVVAMFRIGRSALWLIATAPLALFGPAVSVAVAHECEQGGGCLPIEHSLPTSTADAGRPPHPTDRPVNVANGSASL